MHKMLNTDSKFGTWLSLFTKGGELVENELAMLLKKLKNIWAKAAAAFLLTYISIAWLLTGSEWGLYWKYNVARILDFLFLGDNSLLSLPTQNGNRLTASTLVELYHDKYHATFWFRTPVIFLLSLAACAAVVYFIQKAFVARGKLVKDEQLRGAEVAENQDVIDAVNQMWVEYEERHNAEIADAKEKGLPEPLPLEKLQPRFTFTGIPLPPEAMQQNVLATGGMGTGKSTAIFDLADQVAAVGLNMIIYDKVGEFVEYYYRAGRDIIFCPLDSRSPGFNLFAELENDYDFENMANGFIPPSKEKSDGEIFKSAARTLLVEMLRKLKEEGETNPARATTECLWECITSPPEALEIWLAGTPAATLLGKNSSKNGGAGALENLKEACKVLQYVRSGDGSFSLKKFIREGGDRRLFLTSNQNVHEMLKPLTALALNILLAESMAGQKDPKHLKRVFFIDEFKSLGMVDMIGKAITEGRKFGNGLVFGAQGIHQFDIFDKVDSKDIRANLSTQLIMRVADEETGDRYSKLIGEAEVKVLNENHTWGADARDGGGVSSAIQNRRAVMASEIARLPNRTGYLKFPGDLPFTKVAFPYKGRKRVAIDWSPRDLRIETVREERRANAEARRNGKVMAEEDIAIPTVASETARTAVVEEVDGQELFDTVVGIFKEAAAKQETGSAPSPEVVETAPEAVVEAAVVAETPVGQAEASPEAPASDDSVTSAEAALQAALASIR